MNVVDSLIVTLGLDPSGYKQGAKDAIDAQKKLKDQSTASGKAIELSADKAGESVAALGRKFLALYALLTAGKGIKEFVSDITSADAALGRTAKNLDMSGRNLSAWQNAATVAGGSAEGITGTLKSLTSEMQKAALTGQSSIIPVFRALGINLADAKGHAKDATDVLRDLNKVYNERHIDPARFTELAHMAGVDDGTIALLEKSTAEFNKLIVEQQKYAATAEDIDAAQKRQSGWRELIITSESLGRSILTVLTPAITTAMKAVQDWANANQEWIKTKVAEYAEQFATWIKSVDWAQVGAQFATLAANVGTVAAAFASAVSGVNADSALYKAFEAFGAMLAVSVIARLARVAASIAEIGKMPLPSILANPLVVAGAGIVAAGGLAGAMNSGHTDDYGRDAGTWGGDGPLKDSDIPKGRPTVNFNTMWSWLKGKVGLGDDPKIKDAIADTAKATGEIRDIMKAQKDAAGADATAGGGGGIGGGGARLGDRGTHGSHGFSGGGMTPAKGALAANQKEAYDAAIKEGLSPTAARALVGNMSGEGLAVPHDYHWDGKHYSGGIVQWDPQRAAAIKAKFGDVPWKLSVADQTRAAIWEIQNNPRFAETARALKGNDPREMIGALVDNYESPKERALNKIKRMGYYNGFNPGAAASGVNPAGAGTPAPSAVAISDAEAFAAHQRLVNGGQNPADRALYDRYLKQQNAPHSPPTYDDGAKHLLKVLRHARSLTHHNDNKPVPVMPVDSTGSPHHASLARITHMAALGRSVSNRSMSSHVDNRIREMHVHTAARDGREFAGQFRDDMRRRGDVTQANFGLA